MPMPRCNALRQIYVSGASVLRAAAASKRFVIFAHTTASRAFFPKTQAPKLVGDRTRLDSKSLVPRPSPAARCGMGKARAGSGQLAAEKPASERAQGAARV